MNSSLRAACFILMFSLGCSEFYRQSVVKPSNPSVRRPVVGRNDSSGAHRGSDETQIAEAWSAQISGSRGRQDAAHEPDDNKGDRTDNEEDIRRLWQSSMSDSARTGSPSAPYPSPHENNTQRIVQAWHSKISGSTTEAPVSRPEESHASSDAVAKEELPAPRTTTGPRISEEERLGRYYALVIGIDEYPFLTNLKTATNDATAIKKTLETQYGYSVELLINPDRRTILSSFNEYRKNLSSGDGFLVYYAGHGWYDKGADSGYWLPSNAEPDNEAEWLSHSYVTSVLRALDARHVMIVADSCYSGKLTRGLHIVKKSPGYWDRVLKKKTRVVLTSGGLEPVLDSGGKNGHSVFASAFLEQLENNESILDGTTLFAKLRRKVMLDSDQVPEYSDIRKAGHDGGDFLFIRER
jgi:hypothetical protein